MKTLLFATLSVVLSAGVMAGHHEAGEAGAATVIGAAISDDGTSNPLMAGDIAKQQMWLDYIQAHNGRDLEKLPKSMPITGKVMYLTARLLREMPLI